MVFGRPGPAPRRRRCGIASHGSGSPNGASVPAPSATPAASKPAQHARLFERREHELASPGREGTFGSIRRAEQHEPLRERVARRRHSERTQRGGSEVRSRVGHAGHAEAREAKAERRQRLVAEPLAQPAVESEQTRGRPPARVSSTPGASTPSSGPSRRTASELSIQRAPLRCWMRTAAPGSRSMRAWSSTPATDS